MHNGARRMIVPPGIEPFGRRILAVSPCSLLNPDINRMHEIPTRSYSIVREVHYRNIVDELLHLTQLSTFTPDFIFPRYPMITRVTGARTKVIVRYLNPVFLYCLLYHTFHLPV
jgi:hypothetical protein